MTDPRPAALQALADMASRWPLLSADEVAAVQLWLGNEDNLGQLLAHLDPTGDGLQDFLPQRILSSCRHPYLQRCARAGTDAVAGLLRKQMAADLRLWQQIHNLLPSVDASGVTVGTQRANDPFRQPAPWSADADRTRLLGDFACRHWADLVDDVGTFVQRHGLGREQGCVSYRLAGDERAALQPIEHFAAFDLAWFVGSEQRLQSLTVNTQRFLDGLRAHNTLIWGPRGCGKSSAIRGLITRHWQQGLRGIEVAHSHYHLLPQLFDCVRKRPERFIAVLDNIAFDRADPAVRHLSSVLDGGLETAPDNLVFYATSNFKDLVDRDGERPQGPPPMQADAAPLEVRRTDSQSVVRRGFDPQGFQRLDERRALDDRFPLKVFIDLPTKSQYDQLVVEYARRAGVDLPEDELLAQFEIWRMRNNHDLVGGRTARDFVLSCYRADKRC